MESESAPMVAAILRTVNGHANQTEPITITFVNDRTQFEFDLAPRVHTRPEYVQGQVDTADRAR